ncbi:MAG TPA: alpha/beta fold hydrolase [Streptosporangiaceae bacterium]|nr:alpha/beta fold hydrolase [Streptosporangiaceae bacterium]
MTSAYGSATNGSTTTSSATTSSATTSRWFLGDVTSATQAIRLICLPHAGGCASSYRRWLGGSDPEIGVVAVQLPGRETRIDEPPITRITELVAQLSDAVQTVVVQAVAFPRIVLFGHSMGALIATELCRSLEGAGCPVEALVVSGHAGPEHRSSAAAAYLDDDALVDQMASLDASVGERVADPALRELFLPLVRADIALSASDLGREPVAAPITVIAGDGDYSLAGRDLSSWAGLTRSSCRVHRLPGDHFYLAHSGAAVLRIVRAAITPGGQTGVR